MIRAQNSVSRWAAGLWPALGLALGLALLASLLASCSPFDATSSPTHWSPSSQAMAAENRQPGSTGWAPPSKRQATTSIQAYLSAMSAAPGDRLSIYASVTTPSTPIALQVFRLGWYGGAGGRLMASAQAVGTDQGHWDAARLQIVDCPTCWMDSTTHLIEARWSPTFTLTIPTQWYTGVYQAILTDSADEWTYLTFVVRGAPTAAYLAALPVTTMAAYNDWGGYSLYHGLDGTLKTRAYSVSFDRPFSGLPLAQGLAYDIDALRWFERYAYDVSYVTSVDLNDHPEQVLRHGAFLSLGHDEYWSAAMRDGVERARDAGIGLVFMGANAAYWRIRLVPDSLHQPDRTVVCYKDAALDPLHGIDDSQVTDQWRALGRPENALIGVMYSNHSDGTGFPWRLNADAGSSSLLAGTGLTPGQTYGCDLVGYEWDRVFDNGSTPAGLRVLATSSTIAPGNSPDHGDTVYYVARSGALVFASGSIYWSYGLDDYRWQRTSNCLNRSAAIPGIQRLMANIMAAVIVRHAPNARL